jgi:hypothetical protein
MLQMLFEAQIAWEARSDFTHETLEREFPDQ